MNVLIHFFFSNSWILQARRREKFNVLYYWWIFLLQSTDGIDHPSPTFYDRINELNQSAQQSSKELADNNFKCDICFATLRSRRTLYEHIRGTHDCVQRYRCQHCDVTFKWRSGLQRHRPKCHLTPGNGESFTNVANIYTNYTGKTSMRNDEIVLD